MAEGVVDVDGNGSFQNQTEDVASTSCSSRSADYQALVMQRISFQSTKWTVRKHLFGEGPLNINVS